MKFLLDAQLPKKLSVFLKNRGYDAIHTLDLPNKNRTKDNQINKISIEEKRVLLSKDSDFIGSLIVSDKPYKLIFVSTGNITNKELIELFSKNLEKIVELIDKNRFIELTDKKIIVRI